MLEVYFGDRNKKRYKDESVKASRFSSGISDCFGSQSTKLSDSKEGIGCHRSYRSQSNTHEHGRGFFCSSRQLLSEALWKEGRVRQSEEGDQEERQSQPL